MEYEKMLERYYKQTKVCPECKKTVSMRDWPVMPSNGKPKRTCCLSIGWNNKRKYESRKKVVNGIDHWLCRSCDDHKTADQFYKTRGMVNSICKQCHSTKYLGYKSPTSKKEQAEAKKRKLLYDNELIECSRCSRQIKRKYWPRRKNGSKADICCSEKTTANINRILSKKGRRFCGCCESVLDHSEFWARSDGKLMNPCKHCRKIFGTRSGSTESRTLAIKLTDDATLTKDVVRNLFIDQKNCIVCNSPMSFENKTMDHIMPLSKGGKHTLGNVMIICNSCNSTKHAKLPSDWYAELTEDQRQRISSQNHIDMEVFK